MPETVTSAPVEQVNSIALEGTNNAADVAHHGLSFIDLFANADIVVKLVIISLAVASVWSWTIIFEKWSKFKTAKFKAERFEANFWAGNTIEQLYEKQKGRAASHPIADVFVAGMEELQKSGATAMAGNNKDGIRARISTVMHVAKNRALDELETRLNFLATVGSATPFVGLFGTVWGIMASFSAIASAKNVSLAVVAPGIAEALFATAIGLVAAIPAVIAYNKFSTELDKFANRLDDFSDEFETLISRQLDEGKI